MGEQPEDTPGGRCLIWITAKAVVILEGVDPTAPEARLFVRNIFAANMAIAVGKKLDFRMEFICWTKSPKT